MQPYLLGLQLLLSVQDWLCHCGQPQLSFDTEVNQSELIFSGTVLTRKVVREGPVAPLFQPGVLEFQVQPGKIWKGASAPGFTVYFTKTNCPMELVTGQEYLLFFPHYPARPADSLRLDHCSHFAFLNLSDELGLLKARFDASFRSQLGADNSARLNSAEAEYVAALLPRENFQFSGKRLAFFKADRLVSKREFLAQVAAGTMKNELLRLSGAEKFDSGGYDAVLQACPCPPLNRAQRRRLVRRLGKG